MRICFFGDARDYRVQRLVRYYVERGYECLLLAYSGQEGEIDNVSVEKLPNIARFRWIAGAFRLCRMWRVIRRFRPDCLYIVTVWPRGIYGALLHFHPLVLSAWGSDISITPEQSLIRRMLVKYAVRTADVVRVHDEAAKARVMELGCTEEKIVVHVLGVDTIEFSPQARSTKIRDMLGLSDSLAVISVRKLIPYYDVETLILAIPKVVQNVKNVKFVICGDGNQKASLMELTGNLGVVDFVTFLGAIPHAEIAGYLASADIFVETYHTLKAGGGIGSGLMEAMSCGLVPVVARRPGIEFGVEDGVNGLHFDGGDPDDLARKITYMLENKDKVQGFGNTSREYMLEIGNTFHNQAQLEKEINLKLFGDKKMRTP